MKKIIKNEWICERIYFIRGQKVMLSNDLAQIYGVEPRTLIQAFKRNIERFPKDFAFQLEIREVIDLKSQFVISSWGGSRVPPYAFTELGIAMLSSVLNSPQAIQVNIEIMRTFVNLRSLMGSHRELSDKIIQLEKKYDHHFKAVFDALRDIIQPPNNAHREIGIHTKPKS
jgi:hypothetical protein